MKPRRTLIAGIAIAAVSGAIWAAPDARRPGRHDDTTMRPEQFTIDPGGGTLKIHGVIRVVNPDAPFDHDAVIRLSIFDPASGEELHSEDLGWFPYPRNHPRNIAYPVRGEFPIDAAGLGVKVAVVDAVTGSEFASIAIQ